MEQSHRLPLRNKRTRSEQVKDIYRLRFDHKMGYEQIADKYGITRIQVCNAISAHKKALIKQGVWYPKKRSVDVVGKIMREAYVLNFSPKQIAGYFKISVGSVYNKINVAGLKSKMVNR